ncbi:(2Fe-2S)-binding protein, partial [Candidatus Bipolaricaulota bacterium]|nr:(2Fe-2S)-binding protein [Candidatus Bipolaricaulota bacterium]
IAGDLNLTEKRSFTPTHHKIRKILDLPVEERDELIEADSRYGRVICQCNHVTEGEIVRAIHRGAHTLDGVKFRTCAGFGRCQGGSCTDKILLILARELEISPNEVTLRGGDSAILGGKVRT